MSTFLEHQNWRYATKKFDASKIINKEDLNTLKEAIRLSSSSYGLQPYKIILVENPELRAKIQPAAWGQSQIVEASHLIVFANETQIAEQSIDSYVKNISTTRNVPIDSLNGYSDFMKSKIVTLDKDSKNIWASKQTYLAMGNLLNEILGLEKLGLNASLIATLGYRHDEDASQHYKKVRKSNEDLFITL